MAIGGETVVDDLGPGRILEIRLDAGIAQDAADLGHVEVAVPEGDPVGRVEAPGQGDDPLRIVVAVLVAQRVYPALGAGADEEGALRSQAQGTGAADPRGVDANVEPLGQLDAGQARITDWRQGLRWRRHCLRPHALPGPGGRLAGEGSQPGEAAGQEPDRETHRPVL